MVPETKIEKLREDIKKVLKDLDELHKDREEAGEEREEIGDDVDKIIEEVTGIKEEVEETGEDVEEIKEDLEEIKEDIGAIRKTHSKGKNIFSRVATSVLPSKFAFKDVAQQIVGAMILSAPFVVTEEVWNLARNLDALHIIAIITITLLFDILLFYFTKYQQIEEKSFFLFPKRILSLIIVTYATSAVVLSVFGVIGGQIQDTVWATKLIVMVGLFANIGAGTADLIR
ncbi:hypothetical protein CMO93_05735 [Candidatus Woesearchaeota archaeon]|nr:hypothetical protein [Candidatus Woesearchaeota archaeon]|tara:strand:- start:917 stop:1603 length:687 start_codon:yes stop_codon:yes gene_type:complete